MKHLLIFISLFFAFQASADQLAYLTKVQAEQAVTFLKKNRKVTFFCGCCDNDKPESLKITDVYFKHTGYEDYYEVFVVVKTKNGIETRAIDLAYVWLTKSKNTIASELALPHDPCKRLPK